MLAEEGGVATLPLPGKHGLLEADMFFLERNDMYVSEKPYSMRYLAEGVPQTNVRRERHAIAMNDIRELPKLPSLEENGFSVMPLTSKLMYEEFEDNTRIEEVYYPELVDALKKELKAKHVYIMDNAVRRRALSFPVSTGQDFDHDQPTWMSHIDFTVEEGEKMLKRLYGERAGEVLSSRWQIINIWRPLRGPVRDWPLGIADACSVNHETDTMPGDIAFPTWATENLLVMHSPKHKWYYLSDQMPDEALIFKSADSDQQRTKACPHAGFYNPRTDAEDLPRMSIDCRAFVLYADIDDFPPEVCRIYSGDDEAQG